MLCNINKTWLKCLLFSVQLPLLPSLPLTNTQTCTHLNILLYIDVSHLNHYQILIVDNMVFNILFITTCQFSNRYISNSIISWLWWCEQFFFLNHRLSIFLRWDYFLYILRTVVLIFVAILMAFLSLYALAFFRLMEFRIEHIIQA